MTPAERLNLRELVAKVDLELPCDDCQTCHCPTTWARSRIVELLDDCDRLERTVELQRAVFVESERLIDKASDIVATWDDAPLPEDAAISAAHPTRSGRHDLYAEAMRLVGAKRSKGALVALVNWLLVRNAMLRDLVSHANPLAWVATRDERAASDWEVKAYSIKVEQACAQAKKEGG